MPSKMPPSQTGRLHEGDDVLGKKKGMHWKTFKRLHVNYKALEQDLYTCMVRLMSGFHDHDI
jgi:hypothetical protein